MIETQKETLIGMYVSMMRIRRFEEELADLFAVGGIPGIIHTYIGEEAIAVGACSNLRKDDYITSTHRGHGHCIAKGCDVNAMMKELFGKKDGKSLAKIQDIAEEEEVQCIFVLQKLE